MDIMSHHHCVWYDKSTDKKVARFSHPQPDMGFRQSFDHTHRSITDNHSKTYRDELDAISHKYLTLMAAIWLSTRRLTEWGIGESRRTVLYKGMADSELVIDVALHPSSSAAIESSLLCYYRVRHWICPGVVWFEYTLTSKEQTDCSSIWPKKVDTSKAGWPYIRVMSYNSVHSDSLRAPANGQLSWRINCVHRLFVWMFPVNFWAGRAQ